MGLSDFFKRAWSWIEALWKKHDQHLQEMVEKLLPMVIEVSLKKELSGSEKKKVVLDAVLDAAEDHLDNVSEAMLNEAVEVALARYKIQVGELTKEKLDATREAVLLAARKHADNKLSLEGNESEKAGVSLFDNDDL